MATSQRDSLDTGHRPPFTSGVERDISPATYRRGLLALLAAAALLGAFRLGTPGVWLDEASSWYNVSGTWTHLWQRAVEAEDTGGILYSSLLKAWAAVAGTSEPALRLPGVLLLLGLMAAVARAATLFAGPRAGLCAAAAALAHPSVLPAARQARGYILLLTLGALALLGISEWVSGRKRLGGWITALAGLAAAATHVFGVFVALGAALWLGCADGLAAPRRRIVAAIPGMSVALPAVLWAGAWTLLIGDRVRRNIDSFWIPGTLASNYLAIAAWLAAPLALAAGWLFVSRHPPGARRLAAGLALFALPIAAGPGLVSVVAGGKGHFVLLRYALPLVPPAVLAVGVVLAQVRRGLATALVSAGLVASLGYSVTRNVYSAETRNGQDTRAAASFLRERLEPGDRLFVEPFNDWMVLEYYGVGTRPDAGRTRGWRVATGPTPGRAPATWLVRFSRRTLLEPGEASRAKESWTFGTITVSLTAP